MHWNGDRNGDRLRGYTAVDRRAMMDAELWSDTSITAALPPAAVPPRDDRRSSSTFVNGIGRGVADKVQIVQFNSPEKHQKDNRADECHLNGCCTCPAIAPRFRWASNSLHV